MTTVSLHELRMASTNVEPESRQYSPENNQSAFELSCHDKWHRGTICEYIVARQLTQLGYESTVTDHWESYDIHAYNEAKVALRIEVKSSLLGKTNNYFKMANIKPALFDYLFFVFVHPTEGIVVKWTTQIKALRLGLRLEEQANGYVFGFRDDMSSCQGLQLWDVEDFPHQEPI